MVNKILLFQINSWLVWLWAAIAWFLFNYCVYLLIKINGGEGYSFYWIIVFMPFAAVIPGMIIGLFYKIGFLKKTINLIIYLLILFLLTVYTGSIEDYMDLIFYWALGGWIIGLTLNKLYKLARRKT